MENVENERAEEVKNSEEQSWWSIRTQLEKGLSVLLIILTILGVTLMVTLLLYTKTPSSNTNTCETQTCVVEALEILKRIDLEVNPCDDFFAFACHRNMSSSQLEDDSDLTDDADESELLELYREPIYEKDHKAVKIAKKIFKACTNKTEIAKTSFIAIKEILKSLGGWPVVEGHNWTDSDFDWLEMTSKLRKLGYEYASLLDVSIDTDPKDKTKYIYKVSIPRVEDVTSKWFDTQETKQFLTEVAMVFGAEEHRALNEMGKMLQFLKDLQWESNDIINNNEKLRRLKLSEVQKRHDGIEWLEYINSIIGPSGKVSKNDYVLFPKESDIDDWFAIILREDKRTQANYVLWKVIEEFLPFITKQLGASGLKPKLLWDDSDVKESQEDFCIGELNQRFSPNPIDILNFRQNLPKEKFDEMTIIIENLKAALLNILENAEWLDEKDRTKANTMLKEIKILIGDSTNYYDDSILNKISFDLDKNKSNNIIKMLAQANLHRMNLFYSFPKKPIRDSRIFMPNYELIASYSDVHENELVLNDVIQEFVFETDRQKYFNYATMGLSAYLIFNNIIQESDDWIKKTKKTFETNKDCLDVEKKTKIPNHLIDGMLSHRMAVKVAYDAYSKWVEENEEEATLATLDYTPKQLFWISTGDIFCSYKEQVDEEPKIRKFFNKAIKNFINNNPNLLQDFECKIAANDERMDRCSVF